MATTLARLDWTRRLPAWFAAVPASVAGLLVIVAVLFRQAGVPRYRTVWAEDGQVFGQCAFNDPSPASCLVQGYDGWLHVGPRILAWAASLLPPAAYSWAITMAAALATAAAAVLVARAVSDATRPSGAWQQAGAAVTAGASLALVYPAGAEVGGNVANMHWILFVASAVIASCAILGHRIDRWDAGFVIVTAASSPLGLLLVLLLGGAMLAAPEHARPGRAPVLAVLAISVVQLATSLVSPRNALPDQVVTLLSPFGWLVDQLYRRGPFGGRGAVPGWAVGVLATAAFGAVVVITARLARQASSDPSTGDRQRAAAWRGPLALLALGSTCAVAFGASTYLNRHDVARYDLIPQVGLVIVLVLAMSMLVPALGRIAIGARRVQVGSLAAIAGWLVLVVGFATTFRLSNAASNGPSYPAAYAAAAAACDTGAAQAVVGISPVAKGTTVSTWHLAIPCARVRN
jgi:hypothetical protein